MWAVAQMKEGNKIRRPMWDENKYLDIPIKNFSEFILDNLPLVHIEATDWEVLDEDKEWNLAYNGFIHKNALDGIKKCRDLIIEDVNKLGITFTDDITNDIEPIINKRFGDLK